MMKELRCIHAKNGPDEIYIEPKTGRLKCRTCKRKLNRKYKRAQAAKKGER